ncbi:DNA repair protein RecO [Phytoactinopolyspora halophila]|uniref:DNA repair protein RecO n=1 Tax=Phytoactinopolyspora halophila TaxID=1981511 RepID=UPI0013DE5935|nr:DNA repair protein RecO [Phytoactinopolyspora halophila]
MSLYRDEGIVLRTQKLGEADRIITVLTRAHGRIRVVGKGVRRTSSRFGARLEPFMHVDLQLATGRTLDVVTQVETLDPFGRTICADYGSYTAGTAVLETAERLTAEEREPALQHYLLLLGALRALAHGEHDAGLVLDAFVLRGLSIAGFAPSFAECARCAADGPHRLFSVQAGGMVCTACRPPGTVVPSPEAVALLSALLTGDWPVADASDARARRDASGITAAFLQWHLERGLRSLQFVERRGDEQAESVARGTRGGGGVREEPSATSEVERLYREIGDAEVEQA